MTTYVDSLIERYLSKCILIDANLALLYLVGGYDTKLIGDGKYNKLSKYVLEDYNIIVRLKRLFRKAVTTPHVLTDARLVRKLNESHLEALNFNHLRLGYLLQR